MFPSDEANIAVFFQNSHRVIARGLKVSIENLQEVILNGFREASRRDGLFNFIRALCSVMNAHHQTEDGIAYPYFRDKIPEAPFGRMMAGHQEMGQIIDDIEQLLERSEKTGELGARLRLENALDRVNKTWQLHMQLEMDEFVSKADALIPIEEQLRLVRQFTEGTVKLSVPHPLTLPFLLFNLPAADRQAFSKYLPAEIILHFIPVTWKRQWASMQPFLLS